MIQEYQYSFEFNIKDFDSKAISNAESSVVCFDGCEWRLDVNIFSRMEAYLNCLSSTRTSQRVPTSFKLSILKQDGSEVEGMSQNYKVIFGDDFGIGFGIGYGTCEWIDKSVFISRCVTDDSVRLKVDINMFSAKFGDPSLDESCFKLLLKMDKDVTLVVDGKEINVHRFALAQGSDFLRNLLYPINGNKVTLDDCDYKATLTAVRFIYTKECIVDSKKFREVLEIGKKFGLIDLVLACSELLTPDNVSLYCFFIDYMFERDTDFEKEIWGYAVKNISEILGSDTFWNLTDDEIMIFIGRSEIKKKADPVQLKAITRAATIRKELSKPVKDSMLCVICQEDKIDTLILPCNHLSLCSKDAAKLGEAQFKKCPLCQGDISYFTKVYLP